MNIQKIIHSYLQDNSNGFDEVKNTYDLVYWEEEFMLFLYGLVCLVKKQFGQELPDIKYELDIYKIIRPQLDHLNLEQVQLNQCENIIKKLCNVDDLRNARAAMAFYPVRLDEEDIIETFVDYYSFLELSYSNLYGYIAIKNSDDNLLISEFKRDWHNDDQLETFIQISKDEARAMLTELGQFSMVPIFKHSKKPREKITRLSKKQAQKKVEKLFEFVGDARYFTNVSDPYKPFNCAQNFIKNSDLACGGLCAGFIALNKKQLLYLEKTWSLWSE
ncbi:MAG: hypothetical protein MRY83_15230 [Flavobacteriales bacterium]|nr:hypothetical protein [Flavobacteriales bacterium]